MLNIRNWPIRVKLLAAVLLPLIGFIYFGVSHIQDNYRLQQQMSSLLTLTELARVNSTLVHELQKERGLSAGYLGSEGKKFTQQLTPQRQNSDQAIAQLQAFSEQHDLPSDIRSLIGRIQQTLAQRESLRLKVTQLDISLAQAVAYYTDINHELLSVIDSIANNTSEAALARHAIAFSAFLQFKERAGIERAVLSNVFGQDYFAPGLHAKFLRLLAEQQAYHERFTANATEQNQRFLNQTLSGSAVQEVERMRGLAKQKAQSGGFAVDASHWFEQKTARINLIKKVEDHLSQSLIDENLKLSQEAQQSLLQALALVIVPLLITLLFSTYISRLLYRELNEIATSIHQVSSTYDLTCQAKVIAEDEIGELTRAFNQLLLQFQSIIGEVNGACRHMQQASDNTATVSDSMISDVSRGSEQTELVASAMSEMTSTVNDIAQNAATAAQATQSASLQAHQGNDEVAQSIRLIGKLSSELEQSTETLRELQNNSDQIGRFITIIDGISEKTNLLALNAAIEAARAGESGRGFAVVADEVRALSQQTKESTAEIANMVEHLQQRSNQAVINMESSLQQAQQTVTAVESTGNCLQQIVDNADALNGMNEQVATAAEQQSAVAEEINQNIIKIRDIYQHTNDLTPQLHGASEQLASLSETQQKLVQRFKLG
ncbi:methyl-accepting chemotaxis protein [Aestuariirhabdus sp. Z084]|uniref:methyl-accepting chemotaxis protein n=1 Tax=Aestuariirhabdus haliotis TaxID=2918751 RepID=UPI00201B41E2|nr:methyl-accepting chemotaxis protein [Aestuariirhabdus haliotis]MCL6417277.1 methyl-accepting chemotaxis protein [Aestuariirhabdus haliotis]MCL6421223.1 methyl-accepting chemotaxis protein [Aestuariirhabdus haliotis]